jgi:hypothetical protein
MEDEMATSTQKRGSLREFNIRLVGKLREDGSMFVTSSNLPHFNAVLPGWEWEDVLDYLKKFLEANVGKVINLRIIRDASELIMYNEHMASPLPAYVIAEMKNGNARSMRTWAR